MASTIESRSPTNPRLPSPPPFPEVQIGLRSPTMSASTNNSSTGLPTPGTMSPDLVETNQFTNGATRRIRPGTKAADMSSGPPLVPLAELESSFQLQEHLKALYYHHTKSDKTETTMGLSRETALVIATPPEGVDRSMWLYELCRLLVIEANSLIVAFFNEDPPCSSATCHEMRASEWQYLCAVHDPPKSCCAIDYCCHTLDWAANVLTSQTSFPSRLTLGSGATGGPQQGLRQLTNIFRRVYRIFAHAWFQHRASFWDVEGKKGLYILFKTVCDAYSLIPEENYTIPPEAEGIVTSSEEEKESRSILKKAEDESPGVEHPESTTTISNGATTRRHKHTPSTGSSVTTIAEGDEDDNHPSSPKKEKEPPTEDPISSPLPRTNTQIHSPTPAEPPASPEKKSQASEAPEKPVQEPSLPNLTIADVDADSGETKPSVDNPAEVEEEAPQPTIEESHEEKEAKPNSDPKSEPLP